MNHSHVFEVNVDTSVTHQIITSKRFSIGPVKTQMSVEIFSEPHLLYDLELSLYSLDVERVRSHISSGNSLKTKKLDLSLFKSSKSIFLELSPGEYELAIVYKCPITTKIKAFEKLLPKSAKFQLSIIIHDHIDRQQLLPSTLNYFGMLGPEGTDFGRVVYHCQECAIENGQFKVISFTAKNDFNFDAIISSPENALEIKLEKVNMTTEKDTPQKNYYQSFEKAVSMQQAVGSKMSRDRGNKNTQKEEIT